MTLAWRQRSYHLTPNVVTLKSSNVTPNVITFNTLLHLGWNVITFKILLHLGSVIKFRLSTDVTYMNSHYSYFEKNTHVQKYKCKEFCSQTSLGDEICSADVNTHNGHCDFKASSCAQRKAGRRKRALRLVTNHSRVTRVSRSPLCEKRSVWGRNRL